MKKINIIFMCLNIGLALILFSFWLFPGYVIYTHDNKIAKALGYKPFMNRRPFTVFVSKDYPNNKGFVIGVGGIPVVFLYTELEDGKSNAKIAVGLKDEISVTFTIKPEVRLLESTLINNNEYFLDQGADGSYDKHISLSHTNKVIGKGIEVQQD